ncbi:hypothetical protein G9A89_011593 [Geosiphon pyriformis]|nr:hypothetical protein G9A89_011593 [Geosiphon pyriformis]
MPYEDTSSNNIKTNQTQPLTSNILLATITNNKLLAAIFLFKLKKQSSMHLFSGAALEKKLIIVMYTDAKVDDHSIKLILDSRSVASIIIQQLMDQLGYQVDCTASAKIIIANEVTKIPIDKIDDLSIKVNSIIIPIKILVMKAMQY